VSPRPRKYLRCAGVLHEELRRKIALCGERAEGVSGE
jgi:hypothetical protein